jgi:hypothetical protein
VGRATWFSRLAGNVGAPAVNPSPLQPPTIDHCERLWVGGEQSRPAHLRFFSKGLEDVLEKRKDANSVMRVPGVCTHKFESMSGFGVKAGLVMTGRDFRF